MVHKCEPALDVCISINKETDYFDKVFDCLPCATFFFLVYLKIVQKALIRAAKYKKKPTREIEPNDYLVDILKLMQYLAVSTCHIYAMAVFLLTHELQSFDIFRQFFFSFILLRFF